MRKLTSRTAVLFTEGEELGKPIWLEHLLENKLHLVLSDKVTAKEPIK